MEAIGTPWHRLFAREPLKVALQLLVWERGLTRSEARRHWNPTFAPFVLQALPPKACLWQPTLKSDPRGDLSFGHSGTSFGDGSGFW